jgi:hypothetical protein
MDMMDGWGEVIRLRGGSADRAAEKEGGQDDGGQNLPISR